VIGHIGFTPQSSLNESKPRAKGRLPEAAAALLEDAIALQEAGASAIVIELVPQELAAAITSRLTIPTIGIGAGGGCTGQIQVLPDLLGLLGATAPRHAGRIANLRDEAIAALTSLAHERGVGRLPHRSASDRWRRNPHRRPQRAPALAQR